MIGRKFVITLSISLVFLAAFNFIPALAHNEMERGDIKIVGGWGIEPPLVGQLNSIVLEITRISDGSPVTNAVAQLETSVSKGGITKPLEFQPQEEAGVYVAPIIPVQTGQYAVIINGNIAGQTFDGQIEIEDMDDTRRFNFPDTGNPTSGVSPEFIEQFQSAVADLTAQSDQANVVAEEAKLAAQSATQSSNDLKLAADGAYLFGMIGLGIGIAAIGVSVVALSRRHRDATGYEP